MISAFFSAIFLISLTAEAINNSTSVKNEFIAYENASEGIKIDYPKGWTAVKQYGLAFLSPKENESDTFREGLSCCYRICCK